MKAGRRATGEGDEGGEGGEGGQGFQSCLKSESESIHVR